MSSVFYTCIKCGITYLKEPVICAVCNGAGFDMDCDETYIIYDIDEDDE